MSPDQRIVQTQADAILDAWLMGNRIYWERRARAFEVAAPQADDFRGQATPTQLRAAYDRCMAAAAACRAHAGLVDHRGAELVETLGHVAVDAA